MKISVNIVQKVFPTENLTIDHVMPKSRGGEKSWTNLVAACKKCNQKKVAEHLKNVV